MKKIILLFLLIISSVYSQGLYNAAIDIKDINDQPYEFQGYKCYIL